VVAVQLLTIKGLSVLFQTDAGMVKANTGIDLHIRRGETLGIIGETGCGKSVLGNAVLKLLPEGTHISGRVLFKGVDLMRLPEAALRRIRGREIAWVPQNQRLALNPVLSVGEQIAEVYRYAKDMARRDARAAAGELLEKMGIQGRRMREYPHQFSGGMIQRVMIGMALAFDSDLLIADEITKGLDFSNKWNIIRLMKALDPGRSMMLITHDLDVARELCDRIAVMYAGEVVEMNRAGALFRHPLHPYTRGLMQARPAAGMKPIMGHTPDLTNFPQGCRFHPRCEITRPACRIGHPEMRQAGPDSFVRCL
jgi:peptide/nickel transport system ATP-binding protein